MNSFESIFETILAFGEDLLLNFFIFGFVGSMIALVWSIYMVKRFSRDGKFNRPSKFWSFLVSLNKVYLPMVAMVSFGILCGIYGIHHSVNTHIENNIHYAVEQLDLEKLDFSRLQSHMQNQVTLEEAIVSEMDQGNGYHHENTIIAKSILSEMGYPEELDGFIEGIRSVDWTLLENGASFGMSYIATDYVDGVFWVAYRYIIILLCLSFLKLPILELIFFTVYKMLFKSSKASKNKQQDSLVLS